MRCVPAFVALAWGALAPWALWAQPVVPDPLVRVSGPSPFAGCTADATATQPGTVYPGSEVEPRLAVDPRDPRHLVGTYQQDRWSNGAARGLVTAVSFDGGATWRQSVVTGLTLCSGGPYTRASDPWVSFAPNGDVYHIALVTSPTTSAILVNKSTDGGLSWGLPTTLVADTGTVLHDKESITADAFDASSRLVYAPWDRYDEPGGHATSPAMFARTTNAGAAWEPARITYDPGPDNQTIGHQVVVLPSGALIDFFTEFRALPVAPGAPQEYEISLAYMISNDKGATWGGPAGQPFRPIRTYPRGITTPGSARPVRTQESLVDVAVDRASGRVYAVWQDARFGAQTGDAIAFAASSDGGATWSAPIRVNRTPDGIPAASQQAFTPTVQVTADGTIVVTYYDFRNDDPAAPGSMTDYFAVRCRPSPGVSCTDPSQWGREVRLTDQSFDMERAPDSRGFFVGDYEGLAAAGGDALAFFSQPDGDDTSSVFFRRIRP